MSSEVVNRSESQSVPYTSPSPDGRQPSDAFLKAIRPVSGKQCWQDGKPVFFNCFLPAHPNAPRYEAPESARLSPA